MGGCHTGSAEGERKVERIDSAYRYLPSQSWGAAAWNHGEDDSVPRAISGMWSGELMKA